MSIDTLRLLRTAIAHHVDVFGRYELVFDASGDETGEVGGTAEAAPKARTTGGAAARGESHLDKPLDPPLPGPVDDVPVQGEHPPSQESPIETALEPATAPIDLSPYDRIAALIPQESPLAKMTTLDEAAAYLRDTVLIPLDEIRLNPVFGVGNPDADLMVIGEAPGADEDRQGEPFVGRAGQLLTQILKAIGFDREDVYIANILKSRPPNNRDPEPDEVAAHIPILYRQISIIRPKVLLCVGRTAGNSLLGQSTTLKALRGRFHDFHGLPVMVTFHPAALLRNSQWKRPTWDDVQLLRKRYDELGGRRPD